VVLVIAAITASLHRAQLREFLLPIPEHMWLDATKLANFTNGEVALGGNRWEGVLH
jgi:phage-related baseplate assembly protein